MNTTNDPINKTDPLGLRPTDDIFGCGGLFGPDCKPSPTALCEYLNNISGTTNFNCPVPKPVGPASPPPPAGPGPVERDLWDWAKKAVSDAWQGTFKGDVWGVCGAASLDAVYSVDLSGCVLDNGDKLGTIEWIGEGVGALSVGLTGPDWRVHRE